MDNEVKPWRVAGVAGMASYIDSSAIVGTGTALVLFQSGGLVTPGQIGVLSACLTISIAVGALVGGRLGDRFGRRRVFIGTMIAIVLGATLLLFPVGTPALTVGMILLGFGSGADLPVSLATISEAADDSNRGKLIGLSQVLWFGGVIATVAIQLIVGGMGVVGGQIIYGHVALAALVVLLLRLAIPESKPWKDARDERRAGAATMRAQTAAIRDLFTQRRYALPFVSLLAFYALTNLAANTKGQFAMYVAVNVVGISVQLNSLIGLCGYPFSLLLAAWFMRVVDGRLRIPFFAVGAVCFVAGFLIPAIFGFSLVTIIASQIIASFGTAFAFEGIMKVWTQESFPTLLRASAQGAIIAIARVFAAGLALVTPHLLATPRIMYGSLAVAIGVGALVAGLTFRNRHLTSFDVEALTDPVSFDSGRA